MNRRFRLEPAVRVVAGMFGVVSVGLGVSGFRAPGGVDWDNALGFSALGVLFLYGAIRGESPAWLEPPEPPREPRD